VRRAHEIAAIVGSASSSHIVTSVMSLVSPMVASVVLIIVLFVVSVALNDCLFVFGLHNLTFQISNFQIVILLDLLDLVILLLNYEPVVSLLNLLVDQQAPGVNV